MTQRDHHVLLGVVEIKVSGPPDSGARGLPVDALIEVACRDVAPGIAETTLKGWAWDELGGHVINPADEE